MTSLVQSLTTYLEANSTITALLASADSIFPGGAPQENDGYPLLTYELTDDAERYNIDGTQSDTKRGTVRVSVWDRSVLVVNNIATTIKSELNGYRGTFGDHTAEFVRKSNEFSTPEEADTKLNRIVLEYEIDYY